MRTNILITFVVSLGKFPASTTQSESPNVNSPSRTPLLILMLLFFSVPLLAEDAALKIRPRQTLDFLKLQPSKSEQAWLYEKKSLVVGTVVSDVPPYREINERHELEGIGADYLGALQRELGIPFEIRTYPSVAEVYNALKSGEVDLVESSTQVEAGDYDVHLSPHYAFTELALFAESGDLKDYSQTLSNTRVAATQGMALELYRRTGGQGQITLYKTPFAAMAAVLEGGADLYLGDTLSARYLSSKLLSDQLVVSQSARLPEIQVGFAVAASNGTLQKLLERGMGGLKRCQVIMALALWGVTDSCDLSNFRERLTSNERDWLERAPPVKLVVSEDLAPYAFFNTRGRFNGIASDVLDIIRRKSGLRFEITRVSSLKDADGRLQEARADLSVLTPYSAGHAAYLFTRPFVTTPYVIVRAKDAAPMAPLNRYATGMAAIASGYLRAEDLRQQYPQIHIEETPTIAEALNRVRAGAVDFTLTPANLASYYLAYKYESTLKINGMLPDLKAQIGFAAPREQTQLIAILDKAMAEISPVEYLRMVGRWRANSATDDKYWEGLASFTWKVLGSLCLLLTLSAWWIYSQRQRINRKRLDLQQRQLILDELELAKESAEKASRSKTVFLTTMSHEIRTPLNAIIGMLELVLTRKGDAVLNTQSVHIAYESAQNLLGLIGDILDISRIESGKLTLRPEPSNLKNLIEAVANIFAGLARQKNLDIHLELDALTGEQVWIDALKFKQILSNLVSNAIKFTSLGEVRISCQGEERDTNALAFSIKVCDTGVGIPVLQLPRVFTPFFEINGAVNNPNAGSGLGLSISHSLSLLMEATLNVQSEIDVGTTMTFTACFQRVSADAGQANDNSRQRPSSDTDQQLTVLIVEDHLPSQYLLDQQISYLGHHAVTANNGLEGLALWQEQNIDIIITDYHMSEMSGPEMTEAIRRMEAQMGLRPCTIIGLTASAQRDELDRCLASGMSSALAKPLNLAGLNLVIPKFNRTTPTQEAAPYSFNEDIQAAMADHVISSNTQEILALSDALVAQNRPALKAIAHKLKGTAYLLSLQGLLQLCGTVEELIASEAGEEQLHNCVVQLRQTLIALNQSLQTKNK